MEGTTPSQYFKESLETSLMEVLVNCAKRRPENPLIFIASCLEHKYQEQKVKDEDIGYSKNEITKTKMTKDEQKSLDSTQLSSLFLKKSFDLPIETYRLKRTRTASNLER